jgi:hypothetical protein
MTKKLINKIKKSKMIFKTLKPEGTVTTALKYK